MQVLVINCGSSSIKCALIAASGSRVFDARVLNLGTVLCYMIVDGVSEQLGLQTFDAALLVLLKRLQSKSIDAVAHRVVHGGAEFTQPIIIHDQSLKALNDLAELAPLHNPPAIKAIKVLRQQFSSVPHVAVFDTAFHSTLPPRAREYALPRALTQRHNIRRYGFHGCSHAHVASAVARYLKVEPQSLRVISCHLGNGASVTAIEYGRSVETSMGMTPLEGLMMGSRAGDVDPGVLLHLLKSRQIDVDGLDHVLNNESGLLGLTGTNDMRLIEQRAASGDESCRLAINLYAHRVRKYIGAYAAVMGGVDAIAFTGGIGEHSALLRHRILQRLDFLGAVLDEDANRDIPSTTQFAIEVSTAESRTRLLVVPADEESSLAREAMKLLADQQRPASVRIPVKVSARHAHLSQTTIDVLFGKGYQLTEHCPLSQPGQYSANETVSLIGPRGRIEQVRVLGPPRSEDQVEVSRTDEFKLGVDAPVRISGDLRNTPGIAIEGPLGRITLSHGLISARRHVHMSMHDAERLGIADHDVVQVRIDSKGRDLIFGDVMVRVSANFVTELHLDTDEANAAGIEHSDQGELILSTSTHSIPS
jgi:acetate kinase